jgi:hypothetical protein
MIADRALLFSVSWLVCVVDRSDIFAPLFYALPPSTVACSEHRVRPRRLLRRGEGSGFGPRFVEGTAGDKDAANCVPGTMPEASQDPIGSGEGLAGRTTEARPGDEVLDGAVGEGCLKALAIASGPLPQGFLFSAWLMPARATYQGYSM